MIGVFGDNQAREARFQVAHRCKSGVFVDRKLPPYIDRTERQDCDMALTNNPDQYEELGPLPEADMVHRKAIDDSDEETSYSADAMEAERIRCHEMGVLAERERCAVYCDVEGLYQMARAIRAGEHIWPK